MENNTSIRKFDCRSMATNSIVTIVGRRGVGKSTLMTDMMYQLRDKIDIAVTMSPTMDSLEVFDDINMQVMNYDHFDLAAIDRIVNTQEEFNKKQKTKPEDQRKPLKCVAIFADDCAFDKKIMGGKTIRNVFMNGRHLNIMFIILVQYVMDITPDLRSQVDYVFLGQEKNVKQRMKLHQNLFGAVEDFKDFNTLMDNFTENKEWLVLDNKSSSNDLVECVKWYSCPMRDTKKKPFCVGQEKLWKLNHAWLTRTADEHTDKDITSFIPVSTTPVGSKDTAAAKKRKNAGGDNGDGSSGNKKSRLTCVSKADEKGCTLQGPLASSDAIKAYEQQMTQQTTSHNPVLNPQTQSQMQSNNTQPQHQPPPQPQSEPHAQSQTQQPKFAVAPRYQNIIKLPQQQQLQQLQPEQPQQFQKLHGMQITNNQPNFDQFKNMNSSKFDFKDFLQQKTILQYGQDDEEENIEEEACGFDEDEL